MGRSARPPPARPAMRPQSCKSKGRRLQQRVAQSILAHFPHLGADDVVSTSMGAGGEDVRLSPEARAVLPLSLECKCTERLNLWSALEQATANAPAGATPCVVFSRNRSPTYAALPWAVVVALYARAQSPAAIPARLRSLLRQLSAVAAELPPEEDEAGAGGAAGAGDDDGVADEEEGEEEEGEEEEADA